MRSKTLTIDCGTCDLCRTNEQEKFECLWGQKAKIMEAPKGKKAIKCKLINKEVK